MIVATRNTLSMESYRQRLAGLVDEAAAYATPEVFDTQAVDLALIMAELYNRDELDPKALWSRIATGLEQSARENANSAAALVNGCLLHVKADAGRSACNERFVSVLDAVTSADETWQRQWARWIVNHIHIIVVKARARWQEQKEARQ